MTRKSAMTREALIAAGVRNLKEFGYTKVNSENILTDYVFAPLFRSMLVEHETSEALALVREIDGSKTE
jgi:hypothetical protein